MWCCLLFFKVNEKQKLNCKIMRVAAKLVRSFAKQTGATEFNGISSLRRKWLYKLRPDGPPGSYVDLTYWVSSTYSFWGYPISPDIPILSTQTKIVKTDLYHFGYGRLG